MASKESSSSASDLRAAESRAVAFDIDLNAYPSSPSTEAPLSPGSTAYEAVRTFLGTPCPAPGHAADLPSEVRNTSCVCGRADARGATVICDGCERWFHLSCAGLRSRQAIQLEDWVCGQCAKGGVDSKRWPLGGVCSGSSGPGVRLLDINALPPSDGEGEQSDELGRVHTTDERSLATEAATASTPYLNVRNGLELQGGFGATDHLARTYFDGMHHRTNTNRSFEETDPGSKFRGRFRSTSFRKKEPARFPRANSSVDGVLSSGCGGTTPAVMEMLELSTCGTGVNARLTEAGVEGNGACNSQQLNDGFPVQYEDFFILHLGQVDTRTSYHIRTQIWPVGYQSCWHDKITGSLFTCYILDGGDCGPIFKVKRYPCSRSYIPSGSTILSKMVAVQSDAIDMEVCDDAMNMGFGFDEDDVVQMCLSAPDLLGQDLLSCLGSELNEAVNVQTLDASQPAGLPEKPARYSSENATFGDKVGEFFVEERSSSLVWTKVSEALVDACREVYKQSGIIRFYCKHDFGRMPSDQTGVEIEHGFGTLDKFCNFSGNIPLVVSNENELDTSCKGLRKWLSQDRFGLDVDFVQEIIEQLPGVHACSAYDFLTMRKDSSVSLTLGSGLLRIARKNGVYCGKDDVLNELLKGCKSSRKQDAVQSHEVGARCLPPVGRPVSSTLSAELSSDVLQVWEFLWRFSEILGINQPLAFEELEKELIDPWFNDSNFLEKIEKEIQENRAISSLGGDDMILDQTTPGENIPKFIKVETLSGKEASFASRNYHRCTGLALAKAHGCLLKVLVSELQARVAAVVDPTFDNGESKSRRGRKKDVDSSFPMKRSKVEVLPINELTWPELARRYILAVLSMEGNLDSSEITSREGGKVFRCLQGDGGVICGSLIGVAGMEADALLLAEATNQVCGSLKQESDVWPMEDKDSDAVGACETTGLESGSIPEWAQVLEPVRKLPTNVGTRIRKCVYEALDKDPPEWARNILQHSISKEVYKGNASGPTKKAVLSVLADVCGEGRQQKPVKERKKGKNTNTISDIVMKQCRFVLRRAAAADEAKTFCNLLGTTYSNPNDNDDEGFLGTPAMVSRPLDFRTIDLRLAVGAYGGCHEAFLEDVREVWHNIFIAFGDQPELMQLAETLSKVFESMFENEVLTLVEKFKEHVNSEGSNSDSRKEQINAIACVDVPKAPWDEGVCKVCGIDKDDESVLLCDTCDSEYHTYCLVPPLARIPEGNWYCPSCVAAKGKAQDTLIGTRVMHRRRQKRYQGQGTHAFAETLNLLAATMREKEYWEFSVNERVFLLKFLCDEVLNSSLIREHLDQCADMSSDLQQKMRSLAVELKNLKFKEEIVSAKFTKESVTVFDGVGEAVRDRVTTVLANHGRWTGQRQTINNKYPFYTACTDPLVQAEDVPEENKNPHGFYFKGISEKLCNGSRTDYMEVSNPGNLHSVKDGSLVRENTFPNLSEPDRQNEQPQSTHKKSYEELNRGLNIQSNVNRKLAFNVETNGSVLPSEYQGYHSVAAGRTHVKEHAAVTATNLDNILLGHHSHVQPDVNEPRAHNLEANSLKTEILLMQDSIAGIESQLLKLSMRRELLGGDSFGRLYWVLNRPGKRPWLVVDGSTPLQSQSRESECRGSFADNLASACSIVGNDPDDNIDHGVRSYPSCAFYESDLEIQELVQWLVDSDPREKELKESIVHLQRLRSQETRQTGSHVQSEYQGATSKSFVSGGQASSSFVTNAASILQKRYGPWLELETIDVPKKRGRKAKVTHEDRLYRCECLELIWPSRQHCFSCHQTFCTVVDFESHNDGKCSSAPPDDSKENAEPSKGKGVIKLEATKEYTDGISKNKKFDVSSRLMKFQKKAMVCPYNFEEISRKFIVNYSNKELVKEIGLLGSNGIPMLIPSTCPYLDDPTLILDPAQKSKAELVVHPTALESVALQGSGDDVILNCKDITEGSPKRIGEYGRKEVLKTEVTRLDCMDANDLVSSVNDTSPDLDAGDGNIVPDSSLRPLVGRNSEILRRLKINLLDIDAALPEEALRPIQAHHSKRCAWRAFVKSADSILEMVKAAIVFEDMIKTKYLRNGWWYWSSLSAAARTSTLSSLALRIYTLDASIIYENASPAFDGNHPMDNLKSGKKRKETEG